MTRFALVALAAIGTAATAVAQYPYPSPYYQPPAVMPNVYNPQYQPLSPYLNLLRGGNPGVNYYYGVRPGTVGGTGQSIGAPFTTGGAARMPYFPQQATAPDPLQPPEIGSGNGLPPAGHPTVFNNTGGYFPSPLGNRGGQRPGLTGLGSGRR